MCILGEDGYQVISSMLVGSECLCPVSNPGLIHGNLSQYGCEVTWYW